MKKQYINLDEGLAIYQKEGTPNWYVYFYLKKIKKANHKSLETTSLSEATKRAVKVKIEAESRLELGFNPVPKSLSDVLVEYHNEIIKSTNSTGDLPYTYKGKKYLLNDTVRREMRYIMDHLVEKTKAIPIDNVRMYDLEQLLVKDNEKVGELAQSTLSARTAFFNKFFIFACDQKRYLTKPQIPTIPKLKTKIRTVRASFSEEQVEAINRIMLELAQFPAQNKPSQITIDNRWLLYYLFNFNLYLGSRTGREIVNNFYKDIKKNTHDGQTYYSIHVYQGKTQNYSRSREMTISRKSEEFLEALTQYTLGCSLDEAIEKHPKKVLFARPSDKIVPNFSELWEKVREIAVERGIIESDKQHLYTLYSTRHFFVSNALLKGGNSELSLAELSQHVGTSAKIIQDTYTHISSIQSSGKYLNLFESEDKKPKKLTQSNAFEQKDDLSVFGDLAPFLREYETGEEIIKRIVKDEQDYLELKAAIAYITELQGYDETLEPYLKYINDVEVEEFIEFMYSAYIGLGSLLYFNNTYDLDKINIFNEKTLTLKEEYELIKDKENVSLLMESIISFCGEEEKKKEFLVRLFPFVFQKIPFKYQINVKGEFFSQVVSMYCISDYRHLELMVRNPMLKKTMEKALTFHKEMFDFIEDTRITQKAVFTLLDHYSINTDDMIGIAELGKIQKYKSLIDSYLEDQKLIDEIMDYFAFGSNEKITINE